MRPGVIVSIIGHVGAVLMTLLAWEARTTLPPESGAVVPVEIVDVALESNVRALAEEAPEEETPAPAEAEPTQAEEQPTPTPTPTPRERPRQNDSFDLDAVAGLIDKQREPRRPRNEGERADRNQQGAGLGTAEVAAIEDRARALVRAHMRRCWRMPIDLPDPERLIVTVEFDINRNGTLNGQPRVTSPRGYAFDPPMRAAVDAAVRAVRACDPYPLPDDPVVGEHYEVWRSQIYTFRPTN
jgi:outer membrane biosynthesis protein TonB